MSIPLPTYDQVIELPAQTTQLVPPEFIDVNGHMNITRYLEVGATGWWTRSTNDLTMGDAYVTERGLTTFTAEHHIRYLSEMLEGDEMSTHTRVIARSDKVLHSMSIIANRTRERVSCILELTQLHIDISTRRPTAFPDDIATRIDVALKADDVAWPAPVCGVMGVRRS